MAFPCETTPDTVTSRYGGWLPIQTKASVYLGKGNLRKCEMTTWNGMAIKRLYVMLCGGDASDELAHAVNALERLPVPCQRRVGPVEVR